MKPSKNERPLKNALNALLFSGGLLLVIAPLYCLGSRYYHTFERTRIASLTHDPAYLQNAVWGSSHAECIDLKAMGRNGENLFSSAEDLFEVEYKVRSLLPYLTHLDTAFISMSFFSFVIDNAISRDPNRSRAGLRVNLYAEYPATLPFIPGDGSYFVFGMLYPLVTTDHWHKVFFEEPDPAFVAPEPFPQTMRPASIEAVRRKIHAMKESQQRVAWLQKHATARVRRYKDMFGRMLHRHPGLQKDAFDTAVSIVRRLQERDIRVVLFTPPYYRSYNEAFNRKWKADMRRAMKDLEAKTGVEYYNFSEDDEFVNSTKPFKDSDHLNHIGSKLFSLKLRRAMMKTGAGRSRNGS